MNDEKLIQLLQDADRTYSGPGIDPAKLSVAVRQRFRRQRQMHHSVLAGGMAVLVMTAFYGGQIYQARQRQQQIANMQQQIRQLTKQTEATLSFIHEVLNEQKQQDELTALKRQLASYTDPLQSLHAQIDETAVVLMFRANQLMDQPGRRDEALNAYRQIINYFPDTSAAQTARQRLRQIQQPQTDSI